MEELCRYSRLALRPPLRLDPSCPSWHGRPDKISGASQFLTVSSAQILIKNTRKKREGGRSRLGRPCKLFFLPFLWSSYHVLSLVGTVGTNGSLFYTALSPPSPTAFASPAPSTSKYRSSTAPFPGCTFATTLASFRVLVQPSRTPGLSTNNPGKYRAELDTGHPAILPGEPLQHPKRDERIHVRR